MARGCLQEASLELSDVDIIVAAPARHGYRAALAAQLAVPVERITVADDESMHTASLVAALRRATEELPPGARVLLIAAGAGVTAGAALYHGAHSRPQDNRVSDPCLMTRRRWTNRPA